MFRMYQPKLGVGGGWGVGGVNQGEKQAGESNLWLSEMQNLNRDVEV